MNSEPWTLPVDPQRVLDDLRELRRITSGPSGGAQRVAWTSGWRRAREFLVARLEAIGAEPELDAAGNLWASIGDGPATAIGSHLDSVPDGGWLDGALGVMAGLETMRAFARSPDRPSRRLMLVDFADEEGARFGHSLFGSSAVGGLLEPAVVAGLIDTDGQTLADVLAENGVDLAQAPRARHRAEGLTAYLELHIEQGPVLADAGIAVAAVRGTLGIDRRRWCVTGPGGHAGPTPMERRSDPVLAAAGAVLQITAAARELGGRATIGELGVEPGIATAIAREARFTVDLRHEHAEDLRRLSDRVAAIVAGECAQRGCVADSSPLFELAPARFDQDLVALAQDAGGPSCPEIVSGAAHDAVAIARVVPTAMMFAPSIAGISHSPLEDTATADLVVAIAAFGRLVSTVLCR